MVPTVKQIISVENLIYGYSHSGDPAVADISFEVLPGEILGFLGPSGAGKSTTQKVLIGLLKNYQGAVKVFDEDLDKIDRKYYERIGVSFELPNHFLKLTARENLAYFSSLYRTQTLDIDNLLESLGLEKAIDMPVGQFSKGMKNRLTVARSLLHHPELLFWDEPTAGLDPINARRVKDLAKSLRNQGKTIFLTTHDMSVADEICDRVALIVDGKIVALAPPHELKLQHGEASLEIEYISDQEVQFKRFPLDGLGQNEDFLQLIANSTIRTMHSQEATLEDVFIRLTGKALL